MAFARMGTRRDKTARATIRLCLRHGVIAGFAAATLAASAPNTAMAQSAIPTSPGEQRAIEARLSTILDYARPNEVSQFRLGTGASVQVRAYQTVDRATGRPCRSCGIPCRGYRVDYASPATGTIAVEGFRCRRRDGLWAAIQPETVISRDAGFVDQGAEEVASAPTPLEEVPLPRPSPRRSAAFGAGQGTGQEDAADADGESPAISAARAALQRSGRSADGSQTLVPAPREAPEDSAPDGRTGGQGAEPGPSTVSDTAVDDSGTSGDPGGGGDVLASSGAATDARDDAAAGATGAGGEPADAPLVARAPTPGEVRQVQPDDGRTPRVITLDQADGGEAGTTDGTAGGAVVAGLSEEEVDILAHDLDIIEGLEDLFYLEPGADIPPPEEVADALSQFVDDEALPGDASLAELTVRLQEARARNSVVAACDGSPGATMCFED